MNAEKVYEKFQDKDGIAQLRAINKAFREADESHLFPIRGKFNVTDRAIRRLRALRNEGNDIQGLEYCLALEQEITEIVNNEKNW